jgi:signal transduction histidine kinase
MTTPSFKKSSLRWMVAILLLLLAFPVFSSAGWAAETIHHAEVRSVVNGAVQPAADMRLPYHWDRLHGAVNGSARFRLTFNVLDPASPLALYIPRLGNTYAIRVNGNEFARFGTVPANLYDDAATEPRYFVIPPRLLAASTTLDIEIGVIGGRLGGLSEITVGTEGEVYPIYDRTQLWQVTGSRIVVVVSSVLGLLALLLWFRQGDPAYLAYGLGEVLWAVQTVRALIEHAPLPWPWWGVIPLAAFNAAPPLLCRFALIIMGAGGGRVAMMANALILMAVPAALLTMLGGALWVVPVFQALIVLTSVLMAWVVISAAVRSNVWENRVLALAVGLIVASAVRDVLVLRLSASNYDVVPWIRFAWVGFGVSLAWIIAERLRKDTAAIRSANETLGEQLRERDTQLGAEFESRRAEEKKRGALEERQRLMRDLHDGLGSHLIGVLRMSQGSASRDDVTRQLRGAVDQLKLTVDAMQETDGDIATMLGATRYRLAPRLQAAGIDLQWDVGVLPIASGWGVQESYQLQMILFEAFTNMIVHSHARTARLSARQLRGADVNWIEIEIFDDGDGFDVATAGAHAGKGLASMRQRAVKLGATLNISSRRGETLLRVRVPQHATTTDSPTQVQA